MKIIYLILLLITLTSCSSSEETIEITFNTNGGTIIEKQIIQKNTTIEKPIDPIKENYKFDLWTYKEEEFNFNTKIKENITLNATYKEEDYYTVTFISNDEIIKEELIKENNTVTYLTIQLEGYNFLYWEYENKEYNFNNKIKENIILLAVFEEVEVYYTVTFEVDNEIYKEQLIKRNELVNEIEIEKEKYTFLYWEYQNNKYNFNTPIIKNITLKAVFALTNPELGTIIYDEYNNKYQVDENNNLELIEVTNNQIMIIPEEIEGLKVTKIKDELFLNKTELIELTLPNTIEYIGKNIFTGCSNLEKLTLPFIGEEQNKNNYFGYFFGATNEFSSGEHIEQSIKEVTLTNITKVHRLLFNQCYNIEIINLPNEINSIEEYAFYDCNNLKNIEIPSNVTIIEKSAFYNCTLLEKITFQNNSKLEIIEEYAFSRCITITYLTLPDTVKEIQRGIFYNCEKLISVNVPSNITTIPYATFYNCVLLNRIDLTNIITIEDNAFENCKSIEIINLTENLENLGNYAFANCEKITTINIPSKITILQIGLFANCISLEKIILKDNIEEIKINTFLNCPKLTIYSNIEQPKENWNGFLYDEILNKYYYFYDENVNLIFNYK